DKNQLGGIHQPDGIGAPLKQQLKHGFILAQQGPEHTGPFVPFTFWGSRANHGRMNAQYHTATGITQSMRQCAAASTARLRVQPARRTGREVLRALRAAEMAAWEAMPPSTRTEPRRNPARSLRDTVRA